MRIRIYEKVILSLGIICLIILSFIVYFVSQNPKKSYENSTKNNTNIKLEKEYHLLKQ